MNYMKEHRNDLYIGYVIFKYKINKIINMYVNFARLVIIVFLEILDNLKKNYKN